MHPNIDLLDLVAHALQGMEVTFVGGATLPLYVSGEAAKQLRSTEDVDGVVNVLTYRDYTAIEHELRRRGFTQRMDTPSPVCRWFLGDQMVDIMPIDPNILGFSNAWYVLGVATAREAALPSGLIIKVFTPALLLASKIAAFEARGKPDPRVSPDLEDVVSLLDGCADLDASIASSPKEVRQFIAGWMASWEESPAIMDFLEGHLGRRFAKANDVRARMRRMMATK